MVRAALVLVAALLAAVGCGGGDSRREAAEQYIRTVNRAQSQFEPALRQGQDALRAFAAGRATPRTAERLRATASTMRGTHATLAVVEPPEEAGPLHADLLRLLELQAGLALELSLAAEYAPRVGRAVGPAQAGATVLGRKLRSVETGDEQAVALRAYAEAVEESLRRLALLAPPPALLPWHDDQEARLARSRRDALALASGIERRDSAAVERALAAFGARPAEDAVRKAQAEAVRAFNRRLDEQERLLERIAGRQADLYES